MNQYQEPSGRFLEIIAGVFTTFIALVFAVLFLMLALNAGLKYVTFIGVLALVVSPIAMYIGHWVKLVGPPLSLCFNATLAQTNQHSCGQCWRRYGSLSMKVAIFFIGLFLSVSSIGACPKVSPNIEAQIEQHAASIRGGEYCRARQVLKNERAEIVLYTIEGPCYKNVTSPPGSCGNHFFRTMVGIFDGEEYEKVVIGGKGVFLTETIKVEGNVAVIEGLSYSSSDPMCCPSISSSRRYKLESGSFVEVKP